MNISKAAKYFEVRGEEAKWKHQKKFYTKISAVLTDLTGRNLSVDQIAGIESELGKMHLDPLRPQKHYQYTRKYNYFTKYLVEKLDLVPEKYYEERYLASGMVFGMIAGMVVSYALKWGSDINQGFIIGMVLGMVVGIVWGKRKDKAAAESGQVVGAT